MKIDGLDTVAWKKYFATRHRPGASENESSHRCKLSSSSLKILHYSGPCKPLNRHALAHGKLSQRPPRLVDVLHRLSRYFFVLFPFLQARLGDSQGIHHVICFQGHQMAQCPRQARFQILHPFRKLLDLFLLVGLINCGPNATCSELHENSINLSAYRSTMANDLCCESVDLIGVSMICSVDEGCLEV
jgi:hypothetical protein